MECDDLDEYKKRKYNSRFTTMTKKGDTDDNEDGEEEEEEKENEINKDNFDKQDKIEPPLICIFQSVPNANRPKFEMHRFVSQVLGRDKPVNMNIDTFISCMACIRATPIGISVVEIEKKPFVDVNK